MTLGTLIRRNLRCHWRAHLGVVLGAAVGSAALIGALVVGDSVKGSLREMALGRLGKTYLALPTGDDRFGRNWRPTSWGGKASTVIFKRDRRCGAATAKHRQHQCGTARANQVQVLGVDDRFWQLADPPALLANLPDDAVFINNHWRDNSISIRVTPSFCVPKPNELSREATLAPDRNESVVLRLKVGVVVSDAQLGRFSLQPGPTARLNASSSTSAGSQPISICPIRPTCS